MVFQTIRKSLSYEFNPSFLELQVDTADKLINIFIAGNIFINKDMDERIDLVFNFIYMNYHHAITGYTMCIHPFTPQELKFIAQEPFFG